MGIKIENLCVNYGAPTTGLLSSFKGSPPNIINDLSVQIAEGSFFTLLGPSGCGKTTLLRTLAGFIPVASGEIFFGGTNVSHLPAHQRDIGMVFQDYALFPNRTVFENVAYGLRARKTAESTIKTKVQEALDRVGLLPFAPKLPAALSGGQRQRVALARALVIHPKVLMMDEPLSNLDAKLRIQIRETIADLQKEAGITTIFVTHDQEEALALSDQIAIMRQGKIEQLATPSEIYRVPVSTYVADFIGGANIIPVQVLTSNDSSIRVQVDQTPLDAIAPKPIHSPTAFCVVRPEDLILQSTQPTQNGMSGIIRRRQFLGSKIHFQIALSNGTNLNVDQFNEQDTSLVVGASVWVEFPREKTLILED